jgi:hypothetical protein
MELTRLTVQQPPSALVQKTIAIVKGVNLQLVYMSCLGEHGIPVQHFEHRFAKLFPPLNSLLRTFVLLELVQFTTYLHDYKSALQPSRHLAISPTPKAQAAPFLDEP